MPARWAELRVPALTAGSEGGAVRAGGSGSLWNPEVRGGEAGARAAVTGNKKAAARPGR